jgi:predicted RecA/RadA family phage recombinase
MTTTYIQDGDTIQYTAGANITAGTVIKMGNTLGVALVDIANGATGSVALKGVFTVPKVTAAVIAQGEILTWDVSAGKFDDNLASPATGDVTGASAIAWAGAGSSATTLPVLFTGAPGTVA